MIVADASAVVELLLQTAAADAISQRVLDPAEIVYAPHLIDLEVIQALRRYVATGQISTARGETALADLVALPINRWRHDLLAPRIWRLRDNLTAYDAAYVALAEALDATLVTRDRRLASAPGHVARIELI